MNLRNSNLWIVFNGAIYNYIELRTELGSDFDFETGTDTEVLLAAFHKWGANCLNRLNGMFAFAIWDASRMKLFAARDRFGEKPLYYFHQNGRFALASELKQFLDLGHLQRELDYSALADFLLLYLQDHDQRTFFKQIAQLPAAHWMELNVSTDKLTGPVRYWSPPIADDFDDSNDGELQRQLVPLLSDAIRLRLRSDVPVGFCLSGGLDSTTILSLATAEKGRSNLSSYTIGFAGHADDESATARQLAARSRVRHVEVSLQPAEMWNQLADFTYFQDGPTGGPSNVASRAVFESARADGTTVLLNGQGGDELFAGYSKFFFFWWQALLGTGRWLKFIHSLAHYLGRNGLANWKLAEARRYAPLPLRKRFGGIWNFALLEFRRNASPIVTTTHSGSLNKCLWQDLSRLSLPSLLHWEDRNSMSAGTEVRLPFLDFRVVEAVLGTSVHTKLHHGFTKYSLRQAGSYLPSHIRWQTKKRGFETPARHWFTSELAGPLQDLLATSGSPLSDLFDMKAIRKHLSNSRHSAGNTLTENDRFKLAATHVWMEQLRRIPHLASSSWPCHTTQNLAL